MTDFDFDELDRAVSGALDSTTNDTTASRADSVAPAPTISTHTTQVTSSTPAQNPTLTRDTSPAVQRSSGRFMDVVHPSSDMRPGSSDNLPSTQPVVRNTPTQVQPQKTETFADTLDDWQKPLESPFLPDAKVEKRPLGGEAPSLTDFDALELLEAPDEPRLEAGVMPDPIDFALSQAPETPEVEMIEPIEVPEKTIEEIELIDVEEPIEQLAELPTKAEPQAETIIDTPSTHEYGAGYGEGSFQPQDTPTEESIGPTSINQQYKEQPSSTPEPGAIYDTEAYKPLVPVAKKKSGVWTTLWIVLILLLGGGAGAAIYFYVLPML